MLTDCSFTHDFSSLSFLSQRMDLGECPNVHDLALRADYETAAKTKDYFYDIDVSLNDILIKIRQYLVSCS